MDQNTINNPDQLQPAVETTAQQPQVPESPQPVKKSGNKLPLIIAAIIVVVTILAISGYLAYTYFNKPSTTSNNVQQNNAVQETPKVINPSVEAATSILTGSSVSESSITSTDDSSDINDANNDAANLGGSIDENNF